MADKTLYSFSLVVPTAHPLNKTGQSKWFTAATDDPFEAQEFRERCNAKGFLYNETLSTKNSVEAAFDMLLQSLGAARA